MQNNELRERLADAFQDGVRVGDLKTQLAGSKGRLDSLAAYDLADIAVATFKRHATRSDLSHRKITRPAIGERFVALSCSCGWFSDLSPDKSESNAYFADHIADPSA